MDSTYYDIKIEFYDDCKSILIKRMLKVNELKEIMDLLISINQIYQHKHIGKPFIKEILIS